MPGSSALPPIKSLLAFAAAARTLHFGRAGRELNVSGSAISHQVKRLEAEIGVRLFVRANARVSLTPLGGELAAGIAHCFEGLEDAVARVKSSGGGRISVAASPSFAALWLAPQIERFMRAHCGTRVRLVSIAEWPRDASSFDVAILYAGVRRPAYPTAVFSRERLAPYASPAVARRFGRRPSMDAVAQSVLIGSDNVFGWREWFARFGGARTYRSTAMEMDRSMVAIDLARRGKGLILEGDLLTRAALRTGRLVRLTPRGTAPVKMEGYRMALGRTASRNPMVDTFVHWLWHAMPAANRASMAPLDELFRPAR